MPRLPRVPPESGDPAPDALGPPPAPSAYRQRNPYESRPAEYQAPPMLVEHRGLALVFLAAVIAFALYCLWPPLRTVALGAPAARATKQAPGATQSPDATQSPGAMQSPGATQSPSAAQSPGGTQSPEVVQSNATPPVQAPIYVEAIPDKDR